MQAVWSEDETTSHIGSDLWFSNLPSFLPIHPTQKSLSGGDLGDTNSTSAILPLKLKEGKPQDQSPG